MSVTEVNMQVSANQGRDQCMTQVTKNRQGFPAGASGKELACQCRRHRDAGWTPRSGRSPGGGHGNPLQYSCLENPTDGGVWQAMVHSFPKSQTRLK